MSNRAGAEELTDLVVEKLLRAGMPIDDWFFFGGGVRDDNSIRNRVESFMAALRRRVVERQSRRMLDFPTPQVP